MIDLHTHTLWSDGELLPAELVRRAQVQGYEAIGLTDHVDSSRLHIIPRLVKVADDLNRLWPIKVIPGVELTHVPPEMIADLAEEARGLGARLIVVHGETLVEPVPPGTNAAAIAAHVNILAHPGLLTPELARLAAENGVALELSSRRGHCLTNGHVAQLARRFAAPLVVDSDSHAPQDLLNADMVVKVARGAGLDEAEVQSLIAFETKLVEKIYK